MKKVLLIGEFNSITHNIYRSLMNSFCMQFCPGEERLFPDMYRLMQPDLVLISLVGMEERHRSIFDCMREKFPNVMALCIGNREELGMFEKEIEQQQYETVLRPVTIREIMEKIYRLLDVHVDTAAYSKAGAGRRKRILLIDDSAVLLRSVKSMLQKEYDIDMAISQQEARKLIGKNVPDMIFLDYDMPECDGKMTFEMLKNNPVSQDIPVVFLTGVSERKKVLSVLSMYPTDYLLKPVEQEKLLETIYHVLEEKAI